MTRYLLDTNVVLRFSNPLDAQHSLAVHSVSRLALQGHQSVLTAQVLIEFWVVATRPTSVNGLGWSVEKANSTTAQLLSGFALLEDRPEVFSTWLELVTINNIKGKRSHDIRLIAIMLAHGVDHLLTFNPSDFAVTLACARGSASNIAVIHPRTVQ